MADCRFTPRIGAYYDGETPESETRELEGHLADCVDCRKALMALKRLSELAAAHPHPPIPGTLLSELRSIPTRNPWGELLPTARFLLGLSMILLVVSVGFSTTTPSNSISSLPQSWEEMAARDSDAEPVDEPEAEMTRWVVAGLTERVGP